MNCRSYSQAKLNMEDSTKFFWSWSEQKIKSLLDLLKLHAGIWNIYIMESIPEENPCSGMTIVRAQWYNGNEKMLYEKDMCNLWNSTIAEKSTVAMMFECLTIYGKTWMDHISIWNSLLKLKKNDPFLKRMMTGDEKWIVYYKVEWKGYGVEWATISHCKCESKENDAVYQVVLEEHCVLQVLFTKSDIKFEQVLFLIGSINLGNWLIGRVLSSIRTSHLFVDPAEIGAAQLGCSTKPSILTSPSTFRLSLIFVPTKFSEWELQFFQNYLDQKDAKFW